MHGSMDRQNSFLKLAKILAQHHEVLTYDRRGYATSAHLAGPFDLEQHVIDLGDVIGSRPSILVGHSFGGTVALKFAQDHPDLVLGTVVYENPMPWFDWWPRDTGAGMAARRIDEPERAAEEFLVRFIGQRLWDRLPEATKQARRAEGRALVTELSSIRAQPGFDRDRVTSPVMVGVGTRAKDYLRAGAAFLADGSDARLVVLEAAHHNAHSALPNEFAERLVEPLITRVRQGRWGGL